MKAYVPHSRYAVAKKILLFWCWFIGVGALFGSICMFLSLDGSLLGMDALLPYFQVLPFADILFQNFLFPGIALLIVNGMTNFIAIALLHKNEKVGIICGGLWGVTLMLWICIQFVIFPLNFMDIAYFTFGALQAASGYMAWVFYQQEHFQFSVRDYPSVGSDPTKLVVYFSRLGYTKKKAYEAANATGAKLYEVISTERTQGTMGFWWCGRFGMHRWQMPIEPVSIDVTSYSHVTIVTPIWVFRVAAPMRTFCAQSKGKIQNVDYILVHYTKGKNQAVVKELDTLLGCKCSSYQSFQCHQGRYKEQ